MNHRKLPVSFTPNPFKTIFSKYIQTEFGNLCIFLLNLIKMKKKKLKYETHKIAFLHAIGLKNKIRMYNEINQEINMK